MTHSCRFSPLTLVIFGRRNCRAFTLFFHFPTLVCGKEGGILTRIDSQKLLNQRNALHYTRKEVADLAFISERYLSDLEHGVKSHGSPVKRSLNHNILRNKDVLIPQYDVVSDPFDR